MKPALLYITPCWPHGRCFGSQLRVLNLARALQQVTDLRLAVVEVLPAEQDAVQRTKAEFNVACYGSVHRELRCSPQRRFGRSIHRREPNTHGLLADAAFRDEVLKACRQSDAVWITNLRTASVFGQWRWPHSVMDIDDVPSTFERSLWERGETRRVQLRARWRMWVWQRRERLLGERFTVLGVSSEQDKRYLGPIAPIHVIPNGFERPRGEPVRRMSVPPRLGFIGQFDYSPNVEGVTWFTERCWPWLKARQPDLRLRLVGKGTDGPLKPRGADIDGLGWVPDVRDEIASWAGMIVPVRTGAGTRLKVLEAFSRKCPLVSTAYGAFGHDVTHGRELLLADEPTAFAQCCLRLIREPADCGAMAERAWMRFLREWTWEATAPRVWAALDDCLRRSFSPVAFPAHMSNHLSHASAEAH